MITFGITVSGLSAWRRCADGSPGTMSCHLAADRVPTTRISCAPWDTSTGTERATLNGHGDLVTAVCIAPDGTWLATTSEDHTVRLWDASAGSELATFTGVTGRASGVAVDPSGAQLATASWDGTLRLWNKATGANVATMRVAGWLGSVCWAPNGAAIFAAGQYGPYCFDIDVR